MNNTGQTGGTVNADIGATAAWDDSTGSATIVVAVIDSGMDYTHPDLAANVWTDPGDSTADGVDDEAGGYVDDMHGYDFYNDRGDARDDNFHGTHVAGRARRRTPQRDSERKHQSP